jgi:hypothetical protein
MRSVHFFVQAIVKDSKRRVAIASDDEDEKDSEINSEQDTDIEDEGMDEGQENVLGMEGVQFLDGKKKSVSIHGDGRSS